MNVRLGYSATFTAGVYFESGVIMNTYNADFQLMTKTDDSVDQNIAIERLKYIIYEQFADSIFLGLSSKNLETKFNDVGFRTIVMPDESADQIVGLVLFSKLNSAMEDKIEVIDISIRSSIGGGVSYLHCEGESVGPLEKSGWWSQPTPICSDKNSKTKKIVNLNEITWKSLDLEWNDGQYEEETIIEVKLEKQLEKVDIKGENVVEFKPNDKK